MCGLFGYVGNSTSIDLKQIASYFINRGPDYTGYYEENGVALIHALLSVEQESVPQPYSSKGAVFMLNGEVYNKRKLSEKYSFIHERMSSITIISEMYFVIGVDFIKELDGIFSISVCDLESRKIYLFRDRAGVKPLYYSHLETEFYFSSLLFPLIRCINSFQDYPQYRFQSVISLGARGGEFDKVKTLPKASMLTYDLDNNLCDIKTYWSYPAKNKEVTTKDIEKDIVDSILCQTEGVRPAFLLSGGLDSSLLYSIYKKHHPDVKVNVYHAFTESEESLVSRNFCQELTDNYNDHLIEVPVKFSFQDQIEMIGVVEEPIFDPAIVYINEVATCVNNNGDRVLITGYGADELFGGYRRHFLAKYLGIIQMIKPLLKRGVNFLRNNSILKRRIDKLNTMIGYKNISTLNFVEWIGRDELNKFFLQNTDLEDIPRADLRGLLIHDFYNYMSLNLCYVDKVVSNKGIEVRVPFLSNQLIDSTSQLSSDQLVKNGKTKALLKEVALKYLSKELSNQPKQGFGLDANQYYKSIWESELEKVRDILVDEGIYNVEALNELEDIPLHLTYPIMAIIFNSYWKKELSNLTT